MRWKLIVSIIISVIFVFLSIQNVEFSEIWLSLKGLNYFYLFLSFLVPPLVVVFRAYRWKLLLAPIGNLRVFNLFAATNVGFMANNILPLRMGELVRAYYLGKKENFSKSSILATQLIERFYDMISVVIIAGIVMIYFPLPNWVQKGGYFVTAFSLIGLVTIFVIMKYQKITLKVIGFIFKWFPENIRIKIDEMANSFIKGLETIKNVSNLFVVTVLSFVIWFVSVFCIILLFYAFSFTDIPLYSSIIVMIITLFAIALPQAPGFVGGFHWACKEALMLFGISASSALGFAIIYHIVNYIVYTFLGLFFFTRENLKFSDIEKEKLK